MSDIGDTALSYSEVKALATGNPLLIDKAEVDAELTRLERAERAHHRNQQTLRYTITRHEQDIAALTRRASDIDTAISRRQDTRGDRFTMAVDGQQHTRRGAAGQHLTQVLQRAAAESAGWRERTIQLGRLGGFQVTATLQHSGGKTSTAITLDGAPGATIDLKPSDLQGSDHGTLITRLEHQITRLDARKASVLADIEHAQREITHARETLGQPFPQAAQLRAARDRARQVNEQLEQMAAQQQAGTSGTEPARRPTTKSAGPPRSRKRLSRQYRQITRLRVSTGMNQKAGKPVSVVARRPVTTPGTSRRAAASPARGPQTGTADSQPPRGNHGYLGTPSP